MKKLEIGKLYDYTETELPNMLVWNNLYNMLTNTYSADVKISVRKSKYDYTTQVIIDIYFNNIGFNYRNIFDNKVIINMINTYPEDRIYNRIIDGVERALKNAIYNF